LDKSLKGFIFDLDGVITDTSRLHYAAWKVITDKLKLPFNEEINERLKGVSRMESLEIILERSDKKYLEQEKLKIADEKNNIYREFVNQLNEKDLFPGVNGLLTELNKKGWKLAIGSASRNAKTIIKKLGIEQFFDYIVDVDKVYASKPHPDIFVNAANEMNLVCNECIVVEDSIAGILAAKRAGMFTVGIGDRKRLTEADFVYKRINQINPEVISSYIKQKI